MKKGFLLVATSLLLATGASAQLTLGFKAGLALPSTTMALGTSTDGTTTTTNYGTFGKGIPVSLEAAFFLNDNIGIQLDASYLIGLNVTSNTNTTAGIDLDEYYKTMQFRLSPQLVVKTDMGLFMRAGLVMPLMGQTTRYTTQTILGAKNYMEVEAKGKFSVGFIGAIGYQMALSDQLSIFTELEYIGLNIKRKSTEITVYEINDTDVLSTLTSDQINDNYEDETVLGDGNSQGVKSPYSSLGFNIGVRFTIGG